MRCAFPSFRCAPACLLTLATIALVAPPDCRSQGTPALSTSAATTARDQAYEQLEQGAVALERFSNQLKLVSRFVRPNVVHIEAHKYEGRRTVDEAGSGIIIELRGQPYVLTNRHVIKDAPAAEIKVKLDDGRVLRPSQTWADVGTDVAVMKLTDSKVVPARIGNSDEVEIGDYVIAVGSPFGLSHSITSGIISAKGRRDLKLGVEGVQFQSFFQTDAAINPGNSGGPLVNLRGEVIGLNTAIASNSGGNDGIGFSIPINIAVHIADQLSHNGTVVRAFLGVVLDSDYDANQARQLGLTHLTGARIKDINDGTSAADADLAIGDIILIYDGIRIEDDKHLVNQVKLTPIGKEVQLMVLRNGKINQVSSRVGMRRQYDSDR